MSQVVSVTLPGNPIYVSGTVNSVAVTWTLVGTNTWEAVADKAEDGVYLVSVTAIDSVGNSSTSEFTLYYGTITLITDRSKMDVMKRTEKGFYNASDLNRVGAAVEYLAQRLDEYGVVVAVAPKLDWQMSDIPTAAQMVQYLADVETLRSALPVAENTPKAPTSMSGLDWMKANAIEQILVDLDGTLNRIPLGYVYSGEIYAGEV